MSGRLSHWLWTSIALAGAGLSLAAVGSADAAVAATALSLTALFMVRSARRTTPHEPTGLAHPLRIILPLFLVFQLANWIKCIIAGYYSTILGWRIMPDGYSIQSSAPACAEYLLLHWPYFAGAALVYWSPRRPTTAGMVIKEHKVLVVAGAVLSVSIVGFLATYKQPASALSQYVVSNALRFPGLAWMLLAWVALTGRRYRAAAWILLVVSVVLGLFTVYKTSMRFLLFEESIAFVVILVSVRPGTSIARLAKMAAVVGVIGILFSVATDLKRSGKVRSADTRGGAFAVEKVDEFISRSSSYHADAVAYERAVARDLFTERRATVISEMLGGIPFSGLFTRTGYGGSANTEYTFDMSFYRIFAVRPASEVSFFVSGPTAVRHAFGVQTAAVLMFLAGCLHGRLCSWVSRWLAPLGWIVAQASLIPVGLHGFRKSDFLRVGVNLILGALLARTCMESQRPTHRARVATLTEGWGVGNRLPVRQPCEEVQ